jgi:hypothetical protein
MKDSPQALVIMICTAVTAAGVVVQAVTLILISLTLKSLEARLIQTKNRFEENIRPLRILTQVIFSDGLPATKTFISNCREIIASSREVISSCNGFYQEASTALHKAARLTYFFVHIAYAISKPIEHRPERDSRSRRRQSISARVKAV